MYLSVKIDPRVDLGGSRAGEATHKHHQHGQDDHTAACVPRLSHDPPSPTNLSAIGLRFIGGIVPSTSVSPAQGETIERVAETTAGARVSHDMPPAKDSGSMLSMLSEASPMTHLCRAFFGSPSRRIGLDRITKGQDGQEMQWFGNPQ